MYKHYIVVFLFFFWLDKTKCGGTCRFVNSCFYNIKKMVHYQKSLACPLLVPIQLNFALELHFSYSFIIFQGRQRNHYYIIISICCNLSIYFNSMVQKLLCDTVYESIFSISLIQNQNQT